MRIMLISHSYWPESTPPQRRWTAFIKVFREYGWDVDVVAPHALTYELNRAHGRTAETAGIWNELGPFGEMIHRLPRLLFFGSRTGRLTGQCVTAVLSVPRAMLVAQPDVVVVTIPSLPHIVAGWLIARLRRRPLVVDMRDAWPDLAHDSKVADSRVTAILDKVMTRIQRNAELVVTVTNGFRRQLIARGVRTAVTVHNGIIAERLPTVAPRSSHGGALRVLYMGNHGESQGLDAVVRAAALAGPDVEVRFVGDGTLRRQLMELSDTLGAGIDFWDVVHGEGIAQHYEWADTCVVALRSDWPSFSWTVPSKMYELLATGRHVTALVRGEAASIIDATGCGDVVDAEPRAIARFWRRLKEQPSQLGKNTAGRDWVIDHADMPALAQQYMGYLLKVTPLSVRKPDENP